MQKAFRQVLKQLDDDPMLAQSMRSKLLFNDPATDTAPTGLKPGGRFVLLRLKKNQVLTFNEQVLLRMVLDRLELSFEYDQNTLNTQNNVATRSTKTYKERLNWSSCCNALKLEDELLSNLSREEQAAATPTSAIKKARLKYKLGCMKRQLNKLSTRIRQLEQEKQRLDEVSIHAAESDASQNGQKLNARVCLHLNNTMAQDMAKVEYDLQCCLVTERELTALHNFVTKELASVVNVLA
jgi:hypothetical protein